MTLARPTAREAMAIGIRPTTILPGINAVSAVTIPSYERDSEISWLALLAMGVMDTLAEAIPLRSFQPQVNCVYALQSHLTEFIDNWLAADCDVRKVRYCGFGLADWRYLTVKFDNPGFIDIRNGSKIDKVAHPVTTLSVSVSGLWARIINDLVRGRDINDAIDTAVTEIADAKDSLERSGRVRNEPDNDSRR